MLSGQEKNGRSPVRRECKQALTHSHRLLCVDDEKMLVLLTARVLENNGYQVTALSNPLEAVDLFNRENIELAILDYEMPEMSGTCLAAQLKSARSQLKIVLFTGVFPIPEPDLSFVDAVVHKSEGLEILLATVESLLAAP